MPLLLGTELVFPDPKTAGEDDIIAVGGDLSLERLLLAYRSGLFPWFNEDEPILWWSPDPRCLLYPEDLKISKSMRPYLNQEKYRLTCDQEFKKVVTACSLPRKGQEGTWITQDIIDSYVGLHEAGYAHSVEVWEDDKLVGGLYGVSMGACFFGESMFSTAKNASKLALIKLMQELSRRDFHFIDCQIYNDHLGTLGACEISRADFMEELETGLREETLLGNWSDLF